MPSLRARRNPRSRSTVGPCEFCCMMLLRFHVHLYTFRSVLFSRSPTALLSARSVASLPRPAPAVKVVSSVDASERSLTGKAVGLSMTRLRYRSAVSKCCRPEVGPISYLAQDMQFLAYSARGSRSLSAASIPRRSYCAACLSKPCCRSIDVSLL